MKNKVLKTYNSVWQFEKPLYGILDISLPIDVTYRQAGFFLGGVALVYLLNQIPPLSLIHLDLVEYLFIPGFLTWFFTKKQLDGKAPHRFIMRVILFHFDEKQKNRYKAVTVPKKPYSYKSVVTYRKIEAIPEEEIVDD
ncbi:MULTISPECIES: TcpE family conjugal transfer membrane protein [Bacillaceae]|uniref:TcpE family conjugal transfer membrane protein n=1 Tax=Bacillaceae TaxID=186817 RepID=UPI000B444C46|nr:MULTISPECIES: TcpE family conjugal transfer membrane protein [Bacillus cereus group]MED3620817.1 TcpE family conjugal transfer membrane protein [Bacillus thuringiensis]OUB81167.1 hypothetical protein BK788_23955 [Bacillus thuringiensis serovar sinensis]MBJ8024783.1 conjugal transfer protein [Bacillus cereus]MBJ8037184.1 conjugal transfer protein [Bacillus cereus]HEF7293030.1 conjugal transfer protein [Bacillus cereus]